MKKVDEYKMEEGDTLLVFRKSEDNMIRVAIYSENQGKSEEEKMEPSFHMAAMVMTAMKNCPEFQLDLATYIHNKLMAIEEEFSEDLDPKLIQSDEPKDPTIH